MIKNKHLLKISLDDKNEHLWNELSSCFEIKIEESSENNYLTNFKPDLITIYVDEHNPSGASFAHELLHIEMRRRNILISNDLSELIAQSTDLFILFSKNLKDHIGNCLEHIKMLPLFENLGYSKREFLSDFREKKMNNTNMKKIKDQFKSGNGLNNEIVDYYIGKFFSMKACVNESFNYSKYYQSFAKLDKALFKSLNEFWEDWLTYDINDPNDSYDEIINYFYQDLNQWISNRSINYT